MTDISVLIETYGSGHAVAAIEDGKIIDFVIDPLKHKDRSLFGSIMVVKVDAPVKGINGTFVSMPDGKKGFLKKTKNLPTNSYVMVYVGSTAENHKAQPVSDRLIIKGRYTILTPGNEGINISRAIKNSWIRDNIFSNLSSIEEKLPIGCGLIVRSCATKVNIKEIIAEAKAHINTYQSFCNIEFSEPKVVLKPTQAKAYALKEWCFKKPFSVIEEETCFDRFGVWEQISKYLQSKVNLSNGGFIMIEQTSALIAVDINTGADLSSSAALKTNLLAMKELPRQLQIRGLGGKLVIEFAPLAKKDRLKIELELKRGFDLGGIQTRIVGWTKSGNLELQRKREKLPISSILLGDPHFI